MSKRTITFTPEAPYGARTVKLEPVTREIRFKKYGNGRWAIDMLDENGEHAGTASVNLADMPLPERCVFIKDYSENAGVLKALIKIGVVTDTEIRVPSGYVKIPLCEFTQEICKELGIISEDLRRQIYFN